MRSYGKQTPTHKGWEEKEFGVQSVDTVLPRSARANVRMVDDGVIESTVVVAMEVV